VHQNCKRQIQGNETFYSYWGPSDAGEFKAVFSWRRNACGGLENAVVCGTVQ